MVLFSTNAALPKFTLGSLIWFTSAVAIGCSLSFSSSSGSPDFSIDGFWNATTQVLFYLGAVLIIGELFTSGLALWRSRTEIDPRWKCFWNFATLVRFGLGLAIAGLLLFQLLLNRGIVVFVEREERFLSLPYEELWPDVLLLLLLFVAMRVLTSRGQHPVQSKRRRALFAIVIGVGILASLFYIVTDRLLITLLVHLATDNVEKNMPLLGNAPTFIRAMLPRVIGAFGLLWGQRLP